MRQEFCFNFFNDVKFDYIELKGLNASEPSKSRSYNTDFKVKKKNLHNKTIWTSREAEVAFSIPYLWNWPKYMKY